MYVQILVNMSNYRIASSLSVFFHAVQQNILDAAQKRCTQKWLA